MELVTQARRWLAVPADKRHDVVLDLKGVESFGVCPRGEHYDAAAGVLEALSVLGSLESSEDSSEAFLVNGRSYGKAPNGVLDFVFRYAEAWHVWIEAGMPDHCFEHYTLVAAWIELLKQLRDRGYTPRDPRIQAFLYGACFWTAPDGAAGGFVLSEDV